MEHVPIVPIVPRVPSATDVLPKTLHKSLKLSEVRDIKIQQLSKGNNSFKPTALSTICHFAIIVARDCSYFRETWIPEVTSMKFERKQKYNDNYDDDDDEDVNSRARESQESGLPNLLPRTSFRHLN